LAFGFNRKHFALALGMGPEIETKNAIARVTKFFEEDPEQSTAFDEHLANAFDLGLYLRPEGVSLVPGLLSRTGPFDLDSSFTHSTTEVRFELGEIIVDFERFTPNNNTPLAQQSDENDASLPAAPDETAASMAFAVEGNGSSASSSHFARELLQSIWPGPIEMNEDSATTLSKGQWLASWTGAEQTENGSYVAHFALAGEQATLSEKVSDGDKWLNANFTGQVDCPKAIALLRSIPEPEPWRYDMVEALEKLDRLSWSGNLFDSTLGMSFRDRESNGLAILLSLVRQWQSERDGAELYAAIANGDLEALAIAMQSVTPDLFEPETGVSPLHFAAWQGRVRMVRYFIGKRINVDAPDSSGRTALHAACWSGKEETVRALLEQNATVDARNTNEATPAMGTARMGHDDVLGILLEAGADLHASDKNGHGLVEYAAAGGRDAIVQTLKDQNATIRSPLHVAAGTNDLDGLKELLDKGRKVDEPDGWGGTALLFAASGGKTEALAFLLDKGADPSLSDKLGFTLVHAAAVSGNEKVLQRILDLNPEINPRHKQHGSTPLDWAMAGQDDILAEMLRAKGGKTSWELGSR
jgi:ankyrin repeat protein